MSKYEIKDKEQFLDALYQLYQSIGMVACTPYETLKQVWLGDENAQKAILRRDLIEITPVHILFTQPELWEEVAGYIESKLECSCHVKDI